MDFNMAFAVLNIEMTKDENLIRSAYRMALPANNPEENPEGFKALREAYEKALAYSRIPDSVWETDGFDDDTPIGFLRKKLESIYHSISARIDCESWRALLRDEVFDDLDYYEDAKWALFIYLANNYRIPNEVYQVLDERFDICENAQEYKEKLPIGFVDYMVSCINNGNGGYSHEWLAMLEGADDADYDAFLNYVHELEGAMREKDKTRAGNLIKTIDALAIRHPHYALNKADYLISEGKDEEAKALALAIFGVEAYRDNIDIQMHCGATLWRAGEKEKAYTALCQSLELNDENYIGNKYAAFYEMEHGELRKALQHVYAIRNLSNDAELNEAADRLEQEFIALCEQNTEILESEDVRLLVYAYSYQGNPDKAIAVITAKSSYEKEIKGYHMLLSYMYKQKQDYPMALKYGKLRLKSIEEKLAKLEAGTPVDEDDTKESLMRSFCDSNLQLGLVLMMQSKDAWLRKERMKLYREAMSYLLAAQDITPENVTVQINLAYCYSEIREYGKTYAIYEELIRQLGEQNGLLFLKQRVCYEMGRGQEVIGLFYQMLDQGARDAGIYEYTARVFLDNEQLDDAKNILARADEAEVTSYGLRALKLIYRCLSSSADNGFAADLDRELDEMLREGEQDAENFYTRDYLADLYYLKAILSAQFRQNKRQHLLSAIEVHDREKYHNALASLYIQNEQPQEALNEYIYIEQNFMPGADLYLKMAERYFEMDDMDRACEYVKKMINRASENARVYRAAAMLYTDFASRRWIYYHDVARLWKQYITYDPEDIAYAYARCGSAYLHLGSYQEALFCLQESDRFSQEDHRYDVHIMMGRAHAGLGRYEEAISHMEQGIKLLRESEKGKEYAHKAVLSLGHVYMKLGKLDAAEKLMQAHIENCLSSIKAYAVIALKDMYVSAGAYEKAITLLKMYTYKEKIISEGFFTYMMFSVRRRAYTTQREKRSLFWEVKKALRQYDRDDLRELYSDMLAYDFLRIKEAISVREKTKKIREIVWDESRHCLLDLIRLNKFLRKEDEVARYKKLALDALHRWIGNQDLDIYDYFINSSSARRLNYLTFLVQFLSLTGEVALAEKYVAMLDSCALCADCNEISCYDRLEAFGVFYEAKGEMERAYAYYERAVRERGYSKGYALLCIKRKYGKKWNKEG